MVTFKCGVKMVNVTNCLGRMGRNKGRECFSLAETTSQAKAWSQECAEPNRAQRVMASKHIQPEHRAQDHDEKW